MPPVPALVVSEPEDILSRDRMYRLRQMADEEFGPEFGARLTGAMDDSLRHQALVECVQANTAMIAGFQPVIVQAAAALQSLATAEQAQAEAELARVKLWAVATGKNGVIAAFIAGFMGLMGAWVAGGAPVPTFTQPDPIYIPVQAQRMPDVAAPEPTR